MEPVSAVRRLFAARRTACGGIADRRRAAGRRAFRLRPRFGGSQRNVLTALERGMRLRSSPARDRPSSRPSRPSPFASTDGVAWAAAIDGLRSSAPGGTDGSGRSAAPRVRSATRPSAHAVAGLKPGAHGACRSRRDRRRRPAPVPPSSRTGRARAAPAARAPSGPTTCRSRRPARQPSSTSRHAHGGLCRAWLAAAPRGSPRLNPDGRRLRRDAPSGDVPPSFRSLTEATAAWRPSKAAAARPRRASLTSCRAPHGSARRRGDRGA